jgi:cyanophycin synthetase
MTQTVSNLPVYLIERPEFKSGFAYGLGHPVCVIKLVFAARLQPDLQGFEEVIEEHLRRPQCPWVISDNHFANFAEKMGHWCLYFQNRCGLVINEKCRILRTAASTSGAIRVDLILPYRFIKPSMATLGLFVNLINLLATGKAYRADIDRLTSAAESEVKRFAENGQNVPEILNAAIVRDIPFSRIHGQTYRFGFGAAQQILESTFTSQTSAIGVRLSRNKMTAAALLNQCGLPGGNPLRVSNSEDAVIAASRFGFPVVLKPMDTDGGEGVSANLLTNEDVAQAYQVAQEKSPNIMVDRHIEGTGHRFTVMFGKVVKVTAKSPWGVRGDGISTISDLIERDINQVSEMAPHSGPRSNRKLDDEAMSLLRQYQLHKDSVLQEDRFIPLRRRNNANAGGATVVLDFDQVHQDNLDLAQQVAELFLLDVAGIDLIIPDVSCSWLEQNCLVCDVNSMPQVGATACATFLDSVMRGTGRVQVSLVLLAGEESPFRHEYIRNVLMPWKVDSIASRDGAWINGKQVVRPGQNGYATARQMLNQRDVSHAAVVMSVNEVLMHGLPCDRIQRMIIVRKNPAIGANSILHLHEAGKAVRDTVESSLVSVGLTPHLSDARLFSEMIWPHFVSDL